MLATVEMTILGEGAPARKIVLPATHGQPKAARDQRLDPQRATWGDHRACWQSSVWPL